MDANTPSQTFQGYQPVIKVLGLGGGGSNAIARMIDMGIPGVDFIAANTDYQALQASQAPVKIHLGVDSTHGLGAGGDSSRGYLAADENRRELTAALRGADLVFLTAGMGGGTGTGAISVAAEVARQVGAVVAAIVTTPFSWEGTRRSRTAAEGLARLRPLVDTVITIQNDQLMKVATAKTKFEAAFYIVDTILYQAVASITQLITTPGLMNVDFAHIRRIMLMGGGAMMTIGQGRGPNKVMDALNQAIHHPLLDDVSLYNAAGVIVNFSAGADLGLDEIDAGMTLLGQETGPQADVVMGVIPDSRAHDQVQVILVVTGLGQAMPMDAALMGSAARPSAPPLRTAGGANPTARPITSTPSVSVPVTSGRPDVRRPQAPAGMASNGALNNPDMPAFLRRRAALGGAVEG